MERYIIQVMVPSMFATRARDVLSFGIEGTDEDAQTIVHAIREAGTWNRRPVSSVRYYGADLVSRAPGGAS